MTGGLGHLILAVAVFLGSHSLTNRPAIRRPAERLLGHAGFVIAYSLLSLALLAWMIAAFRAAPTTVLWDQRPWMRWVPPVTMLPAAILWAAGMTSPNPFSIGPGGRGYDAVHPGILRLTRHPVVWGLTLWAAAHILPNGDTAALILFLPLLLLALAGPWVLDRARRRSLGEARWRELARRTGRPAFAMLAEIGPWRLLLGVGLYALLFSLHSLVIGASPVP